MGFFDSIFDGIGDFFGDVVGVIGDVVTPVAGAIVDVGLDLGGAVFDPFVKTIGPIATPAISIIGEGVKVGVDKVVKPVLDTGIKIGDRVLNYADRIVEGGTGLFESLAGMSGYFWAVFVLIALYLFSTIKFK